MFETLYVHGNKEYPASHNDINSPDILHFNPDEEMVDTLKDLCLQLDDFEIIKPLAKGQFGTVS
jgi:hypothetical protein